MNTLDKNIADFMANSPAEGEKVCDAKTGVCYIKSKDGLIERTLIEKQLVIEDGRQLLSEEMPISNSKRTYLR